jgi:hypothetical protein
MKASTGITKGGVLDDDFLRFRTQVFFSGLDNLKKKKRVTNLPPAFYNQENLRILIKIHISK